MNLLKFSRFYIIIYNMNKRFKILTVVLFLILANSCTKTEVHQTDETKPIAPFFQIHFDPDKPGCGDCHNNREELEQTLAAKANEQWEEHNFDISKKMMSINDCLLCHSVDTAGEKGTIAPTPLRTIVHQSHDNCFTCHYIKGDSSANLYNYSH